MIDNSFHLPFHCSVSCGYYPLYFFALVLTSTRVCPLYLITYFVNIEVTPCSRSAGCSEAIAGVDMKLGGYPYTPSSVKLHDFPLSSSTDIVYRQELIGSANSMIGTTCLVRIVVVSATLLGIPGQVL